VVLSIFTVYNENRYMSKTYNTASSPFLNQVKDAIRVRHYSIRTEQAYLGWIKRFILFHGKKHPKDMAESEVAVFLTDLATRCHVAANTQNQALNALGFLYKQVLHRPLETIDGIVRAKKKQKLPTVLTYQEVTALLKALEGTNWLAACLLYGSGLRLLECLRLRVMNLDFSRRAIYVRDGKGKQDRIVTLADELVIPLQRHLVSVKQRHDKDLADGYGAVYLPYALASKYPAAPTQWGWQYVFPAPRRSVDPHSQVIRRHHLNEQGLQRAVKSPLGQALLHDLPHR